MSSFDSFGHEDVVTFKKMSTETSGEGRRVFVRFLYSICSFVQCTPHSSNDWIWPFICYRMTGAKFPRWIRWLNNHVQTPSFLEKIIVIPSDSFREVPSFPRKRYQTFQIHGIFSWILNLSQKNSSTNSSNSSGRFLRKIRTIHVQYPNRHGCLETMPLFLGFFPEAVQCETLRVFFF